MIHLRRRSAFLIATTWTAFASCGAFSAGVYGEPAAYLNGEAITWEQLKRPLVEASGGEILAEVMLDRLLAERIENEGIEIDDAKIDREKRILLQSLSDDPDEAVRLMRALRERRGLGDARFEAFLKRNAALRALIADEVEITPVAIDQAFARRYGPKYEIRLILVDRLAEAQRLVKAARSGKDFGDLAIEHSVDGSRSRGGLLPPISPADGSYPRAIRNAVKSMQVAEVSSPIALSDQFAVIKLVDMQPGDDVELADVREQLEGDLRLRLEGVRMQQLARSMLLEANVTTLTESMKQSWERQVEQLRESQ